MRWFPYSWDSSSAERDRAEILNLCAEGQATCAPKARLPGCFRRSLFPGDRCGHHGGDIGRGGGGCRRPKAAEAGRASGAGEAVLARVCEVPCLTAVQAETSLKASGPPPRGEELSRPGSWAGASGPVRRDCGGRPWEPRGWRSAERLVTPDAIVEALDAVGICGQRFGGRNVPATEACTQLAREAALQSPSLGPLITAEDGDQADKVRVVPGEIPVSLA